MPQGVIFVLNFVCRIEDKPLGIDVPLHPDIMRGSLDYYGRLNK